jgi:2-methylisocitrate lyase-like PEP mutase family enzyme
LILRTAHRASLVDQVIDQLKDQITSGAWVVGDKIPPEPVLSDGIGVGRNTVREAVRALTHAGLLECRQGDGTYVRAGAAAMHIEDQTVPKRCGHMLGRDVIPAGEMVQKIKAAVDARQDPDFVIIARTDARTTLGLDEALDRGAAYHEAGADLLFIESPETTDEMERICAAFRGIVPVLSNQVEGGRTPMPGTRGLEEMGYALAIFPVGTAFAAAKGMRDYLEVLAAKGDTRDALQSMLLFEEFTELIGLDEHTDLEQRYRHPD